MNCLPKYQVGDPVEIKSIPDFGVGRIKKIYGCFGEGWEARVSVTDEWGNTQLTRLYDLKPTPEPTWKSSARGEYAILKAINELL